MERHRELSAMSAKQRAKFAERGITHPVSTFLPSPPSKPSARPAGTGPDQVTVDLVIERDCGSCVVCDAAVFGERGVDYSIHHRKLRSQGGDNRLSNLVLVHGSGTTSCHGEIHGEPEKARQGGWLLLSTDDPVSSPMAHSQFGWVLLDNEGGLERTDLRPDGV